MARFDGKVALITGGGRGIGLAAALAFGREGAKVVVGNRDARQGEEVVKQIKAAGGEATFLKTDVSKAADVSALVDLAVKTYGKLDVAFNNAGVDGTLVPLVDQTEENYEFVMDINVRGVWLAMKYEIAAMLKNGGGSIINTSSVGGTRGFPNLSIYVASKHAVIGLTRTAALEYAKQGIRVNAVSPAGVDTEMLDRVLGDSAEARAGMVGMHPIGRIGTPDEIASAVLWLAADESSFVTGTNLLVDGGMTA